MERVLVVEDDRAMRLLLKESLKNKGYYIEEAVSAEQALEKIKSESFDLVIMDVKLPGISGIDAIGKIKDTDPDTIIIVMTAYGSKDIALKAIREGAYDYFSKPFRIEEMEIVVERALEKRRLEHELNILRKREAKGLGFEGIVGESAAMKAVMELVEKVAQLDSTVLITGESGTGKELIARAIHLKSRRRGGPFVTVNCAAIPENLLESELFGHERGSFTGAFSQRIGKFELANKGTILLDEIGDMSISIQAKLLRVLEQREIERIGGKRPIAVDVRVIASTNKDLKKGISEKRFREDLFFRLNVFPIMLPPLRERKEDIPILIEHFINDAGKRLGISTEGISKEAMELLLDYNFPGNVRELKNIIERAIILAQDEKIITSRHISFAMGGLKGVPKSEGIEKCISLAEAKDMLERQLILDALKKTDGVQTEAARLLGLSPKNLWKKIKKHRIKVNK
ncbi:MAG: sigma-54-dependent Fis family transcriptional regulator [Deltaproteobacteria bacterium]|nr:MAG: sigma-54-dependent Fis family transcriptional regulator [Deltaproteobacteria bacterium]